MRETFVFYRGAAIAAFAVALFYFVYSFASAPTRIASRLGLRGLKRQRGLQRNELWAQVEPLVRWLGVRFSGIITGETYELLDKKLSAAGEYLGMTPEEFAALTLLSGIGGAVFGVALMRVTSLGGSSIPLAAMLGLTLPYMQLGATAAERSKAINRGLPGVIDLMAPRDERGARLSECGAPSGREIERPE